jgi:hypothetical protein
MNNLTANMLLLHQSNELSSTNTHLLQQQFVTYALLVTQLNELKNLQDAIINLEVPQNAGFTQRLLNRLAAENAELV